MKSKNLLDADRIKLKNKILGKNYELSLVFAGDTLMRRLNRTYRGKDKSTNVLAFPISKNLGEIFINPSRARPFGVKFLFIHEVLNLKGMRHGAKMDKLEKQILNGTSNRRGH